MGSGRVLSSNSVARSPGGARPRSGQESYSRLSNRPLHVLAFLLPLIVLYEFGSVAYLTRDSGAVETIGARSIVGQFFGAFGAASFYLPGIALGVVLLLWHVLTKDRWVVRPSVLVGMLLEAAIWTLPLLVLALLLFGGPGQAPAMGEGPELGKVARASTGAGLTLALGAGIYEELLFRLIMITGLHVVLVDLFRVSNQVGCVVAAAISSVAFALYHNIQIPGGGVNLRLLAFYCLVGVYFAAIFLTRGFGVVVGTHAIYDVIVVVVLDSGRSGATSA